MTKVQVYKGSLSIRASGELNEEPFYSYEKDVYGETLGEIFDNLVEASVSASRTIQSWIESNKSSDYEMKSDYWRLLVTTPDIVRKHDIEATDYAESTYDCYVNTTEEIVRQSVLCRHIQISHLNTHLTLSLPGLPSHLSGAPAVRYSGIHEVESLDEMTGFGFTGAELEEILKAARAADNTAKNNAYTKSNTNSSTVDQNKDESDRSSLDTTLEKKRWWNLSNPC